MQFDDGWARHDSSGHWIYVATPLNESHYQSP
jgi:hypothetical protein